MWGPGEGWGAVSAWQQGGRRARAQCSLCSLTIPSCAEDELLDRMARKPSVCESEVGEVGRETIGGWGTSAEVSCRAANAQSSALAAIFCVGKKIGLHLLGFFKICFRVTERSIWTGALF